MRLQRLLAILVTLINRNQVTARELAERFEVSERTILRDMEAINAAGIPIAARQGHHGGFSIMEQYKMDKLLLTSDEILAISALLKGVMLAMDDRSISTTLGKISGLIPEALKQEFAAKEGRIIIDMSPWEQGGAYRQKISFLRDAVEEERLIDFGYTNLNGVITVRQVEPMTLALKGGAWYLFGFCRLREDFRFFRVSRMRDLKVLAERFVRRQGSIEAWQWRDGNQAEIIRLVLRFPPAAITKAEETFGAELVRPDVAGFASVSVDFPDNSWVDGFILSFGSSVEVLEPRHVRERINRTIQDMAAIY